MVWGYNPHSRFHAWSRGQRGCSRITRFVNDASFRRELRAIGISKQELCSSRLSRHKTPYWIIARAVQLRRKVKSLGAVRGSWTAHPATIKVPWYMLMRRGNESEQRQITVARWSLLQVFIHPRAHCDSLSSSVFQYIGKARLDLRIQLPWIFREEE